MATIESAHVMTRVAAGPLLELRAVEKTFANGVVALSAIHLSVGSGAFVSLLGASGCGKSTLLRIVAGLIRPTTGSIAWPLSPVESARPRISFVFQDPTLLPWCSVLDNVLLPFRLESGPSPAETQRAIDILAAVGLAGFAQAFPNELSGGMKMRVSLARALVTEPDLLLLDEPFAALDEITRLKIASDLHALWRSRHFTALFVTHSVFESVYLAERVLVMAARPGRVFRDLPIEVGNRQDRGFRTSARYSEICGQVSTTLQEAMDA